MPNSPSIDGPLWLQIVATLLFGVLSAAVLWRSYKAEHQNTHQQTTFAHLTDMQPIRDLTAHISALTASVERLVARGVENEHWTRNHTEEMVRLRHAMETLNRTLGQ